MSSARPEVAHRFWWTMAGFVLFWIVLGLLLNGLIWVTLRAQHITCTFADGSYFDQKVYQRYYLVEALFAHVSGGPGKVTYKFKYVDAKGKSDRVGAPLGIDIGVCGTVGKIGDIVFARQKYRDAKGLWHRARPDLKMFPYEDDTTTVNIPNVPLPMSSTVDNPDKKQLEFLYSHSLFAAPSQFFIIPMDTDHRELLFEQPLTVLQRKKDRFESDNFLRHNKGLLTLKETWWTTPAPAPFGTVLYVYQAFSHDDGKTWSEPVVTRDAKLFKIGALRDEQPWQPRPTRCDGVSNRLCPQ